MLNLKDNILTINKYITKADTIIKLTSDIDCEISALVTLADNSTKVFTFVKENNYYKGRLIFTEEDIKYLNKVTLCLILTASTEQRTNTVDVEIDIPKVTQSIKLSKSKELQSIRQEIDKLSALVNDVLNNKVVYKNNLNINQLNIKPGMIPVAINEQGLCMFKYPFIDIITEINGQKTVNNAIILTAKDIPVEQTDVESALKAHTEAIKALNDLIKTVSDDLKSLRQKVVKVETDLINHTDSSIV